MRGFGQIAELTAICEPDVGVITNVGPVHLEQMESLEGVARAKAELLVGHARRRASRSSRPTSRCSSPTCARRSRSSRSGRAATCTSRARRCAAVRSRRRPERHVVVAGRRPHRARAAVRLAPQPAQHARRGRRRAGGRGAAGGPRRRALRRAARRARRARPRRHRRQRLLQRQPAVDARRPGRPRHAGHPPDGASRCSATCSSSGRPSASTTREIGAYAASAGRRRC